MRFTEKKIRELEIRDKTYVVTDGPLGVRVAHSGGKAFFFQFRHNKKQYRGQIGKAGTIGLAEARMIAQEKQRTILMGGDFAPTIIEEEGSLLLNDFFSQFKEEHFPHIKPLTQRDYRKHMDWLLDRIPSMPVEDISSQIAKKMRHDYNPGIGGNRFLATMRKCWTWGAKCGLIPQINPWDSVQKVPEKPRETMADQADLIRILESIRQEQPRTKAYYLLILMTLCRRGEADKMKWEHLEGDVWEKLDTKNGSGHRIFVPQEARNAINVLNKNTEFVFDRFQGHGRAWKRVLTRAGLPYPGVRAHDLRRSMATLLLTTGQATIEQISLMLGHKNVSITQRVYARYLGDHRETVNAAIALLEPKPIAQAR